MHFKYLPEGVCSRQIDLDIDDNDRVSNVAFTGGCNGNLKAISKLVDGMKVDDIVNVLSGNTCGARPTSCADQFSKACLAARKERNAKA